MNEEIAVVREIFKRYGKIQALRGLSFKVGREILGLVGPNGAGKTTTIRILIGLTKPDKGDVVVLGLNPWKDGHLLRIKTGVLHEKPQYPQWLSGFSFLERIAKLKLVQNPKKASIEALSMFGLKDASDRKIGGYSAGMIQRLGLAQAFMGDPELVILDEPTANLDPPARSFVLERIMELQREKSISVIISTHILSELERICNTVVFIKNGKVVESGSLNFLRKKYFRQVFRLKTSNDPLVIKALGKMKKIEVKKDEEGILVFVQDNEDDISRNLMKTLCALGVRIKKLYKVEPTLDDLYGSVMAQ